MSEKGTDITPSPPAPERTDWFDRWFGGFRPRWPELWAGFGDEPSMLRVEEFTDGDTLVVRAELPGIDPDKDVELTITDHTLRLHAERREEHRTEDAKGYRSEFHYGSFTRNLPLPAGASDRDVEATYADGVLEVRIPVDREEAATRKIPVSRAA